MAYPCNDIFGRNTYHVGTLTTDSIDCSMYSDITMVFNSFYREYTGIAQSTFSIDGGITFTDTVEVHPISKLMKEQIVIIKYWLGFHRTC